MKRQNRVAFFNILSTVLLRGLSVVTAPIFSRLLGDSGYGVLSIYNVWVSVIAIVFTLQTAGTLATARVEYPEEEQKRYHSSAMALSLMLYAVLSVLVIALIEPVSRVLQLERTLILLMLLQGFCEFCINFLTTKFVYEFKAGRNMAISLGVALVTTGLSLVLIFLMPREQAYFGRIVAISVTSALFGIPACIYILASGKTFCRKRYWVFCITLAIPTVFYNLSDILLGQADRVMLQQMLSEAAVGQYSLALNFAGIMFLIFGALNNVWCPFFFEDKKQGNTERLRSSACNFLELFTVLCVGFLLLTQEVYHVFASEEYWPGTRVIPIAVCSYFLNFLCTFPVNYEYYYKKIKVVAVITIGCSLVNIGLNYVLIQRMGIIGAAVATAASHSLQFALHYGYTRYFLGKQDYPFGIRMWWKYAVCFFAVVALVFLTEDAWLLRWCLGAAIGIWELLRIRKRKVLI